MTRNDVSFATTDSTVDSSTLAADSMDISFVNVPNNNTGASIQTLVVTTSPKHDSIGVDSSMKTTQVCVNMKARDLPDDESQRAPVDIVVCLDVSGSMQGPKLALCKKTLLLLLRVLFPEDRFGLICYDDNAVIEIPMQKMTESNKRNCVEKINGLRTRGCTNISAAIGLAYQELKQIETPNAVQTAFLLTDGHANKGISNHKELLEFTRNCFAHDDFNLLGTEGVEDHLRSWNPFQDEKPSTVALDSEKAEAGSPISLCCFGFGTDHNSALLQAMSDVVPGGSYYFIETDVNVGSAFGDALGGILSVVAQNVVVTISVPEEAKIKEVEIVDVHHHNKLKRENGTYTIVVGDFYAEESRDVLFEVKLARSKGETHPIPHAHVAVSYTDTLKKMPAYANGTICAIARPTGSEVSTANDHVEVQWTRVVATNAMVQANEMAMANDFVGARACMMRAKGAVRSTAKKGAYHAATLASLDDDMEEAERGISSASVYETKGKHLFSNSVASHAKQRCMKSDPDESGKRQTYRSKKKASTAQKLSVAK